jgi:hypothetical protein
MYSYFPHSVSKFKAIKVSGTHLAVNFSYTTTIHTLHIIYRERIEHNDRLLLYSCMSFYQNFSKIQVNLSGACIIKLCCHNCFKFNHIFHNFSYSVFTQEFYCSFITLKNAFQQRGNQVFSQCTAFLFQIQDSTDCFKKGSQRANPGKKGGNFQVLNRQKITLSATTSCPPSSQSVQYLFQLSKIWKNINLPQTASEGSTVYMWD